jgi:hypothetical protein
MIQDQIEAELKKARRALENALNLSTQLTRTPGHSTPERRRYGKVRRAIGRMLDAVNSVRHVRPPYNIDDPDLNFRDPDLAPAPPPKQRTEPPQIRIVEYEETE